MNELGTFIRTETREREAENVLERNRFTRREREKDSGIETLDME